MMTKRIRTITNRIENFIDNRHEVKKIIHKKKQIFYMSL